MWVNGWALERQVSEPSMRALFAQTNALLGLEHLGAYAIVATSVMLWQFLAAASFVMPRLHAIACITGLVFHVTSEFIGIEIRWFSYYMIAIYYLLLFPEPWYDWVAERLQKLFGGIVEPLRSAFAPVEMPVETARYLTVGAGLVAGVLALSSALPGQWLLAGGVVAGSAVAWSARTDLKGSVARPVVICAAAAIVSLVPARSGAAYDYYRFQGGDYLRRGDLAPAAEAYYKAIELNPGPDSRHDKLAGVLLSLGRPDEALAVVARGLRTIPEDQALLRRKAQLEGK
jgi:tetratricopeptide (TPR) repeat protein